jgi:hypothetical protein
MSPGNIAGGVEGYERALFAMIFSTARFDAELTRLSHMDGLTDCISLASRRFGWAGVANTTTTKEVGRSSVVEI